MTVAPIAPDRCPVTGLKVEQVVNRPNGVRIWYLKTESGGVIQRCESPQEESERFGSRATAEKSLATRKRNYVAKTIIRAELGRRIKARRTQLGLTQARFAHLIGQKESSVVSLMETGRRLPNLHTLCLMAFALETSVEWLVMGVLPSGSAIPLPEGTVFRE